MHREHGLLRIAVVRRSARVYGDDLSGLAVPHDQRQRMLFEEDAVVLVRGLLQRFAIAPSRLQRFVNLRYGER